MQYSDKMHKIEENRSYPVTHLPTYDRKVFGYKNKTTSKFALLLL